MNIKKLLGYFFISLPLIIVLIAMFIDIGWKAGLFVLGGCALIVGSIMLGAHLLNN